MKTLKEFDYDLWAIEENGRKRYFARIKATGEETDIPAFYGQYCVRSFGNASLRGKASPHMLRSTA